MTVHFKGISRHQSKHKARRVKGASPQRTMRLAGLRSDQLGICREPQFQSKKRVQLNPPQVSTSLQWEDPGALTRRQITTRSASPPAVVSVSQTGSVENVETPLAPRSPKPPEASETIQDKVLSGHISRASADQPTQKQPADRVNHVLRKKAGLASQRQRNGRQSSEYQRQFQWKAPAATSPLLSAQEMLYSSNRSIPPYKSNPVVMESEYKRSFKGSPPPRGPRLRKDMELNENPSLRMENNSSEKILSKKKKRRHQRLSRKSSPKDKTLHLEPQPLEQKLETTQAQKALSPKEVRCVCGFGRKVKTEYSSNFRSPLQYCYREGAWVRPRTVGEEGHKWYHEVRELREKAEAYRKRAWGTHFSRQHLSQILSEQNCLWEVSSGSSPSTLDDEDTHSTSSPIIEALDLASDRESYSPSLSVSLAASRRGSCNEADLPSSLTLPEGRRKAWDEEVSPCERGVAKTKQQRKVQPEETNEEEKINGHSQDNKEEVIVKEREQLLHAEKTESSSDEGRLPTPKLKTKLDHRDPTPASGGALLVSPSKFKHTKTFRRREPPLGKANSPFRHLSCVPVSGKISKTEGVNLSGTSLAAGMATVDPLPLREDTWAEYSPETSPDPKPTRKTPDKKSSSAWLIDTTPPHANRIQGTLRNPEFQHNGKRVRLSYRQQHQESNLGNLGVHRPERFVSPSDDNDLDDRMSQISFHSAASCSVASQVLDRAQKRKADFWGKS